MLVVEFLAGLRNNIEQENENIKFNITANLCVETELELEELNLEEECSICLDEKNKINMVTLNCQHKFCGSCISQTLKKYNQNNAPSCALCRTKIEFISVKNEELLSILKANLV